MEAQAAGQPSNVLPLPRWTVIIHGVQFVLAIIILGFDAYGIHFVPYNALIFSLVVALVTMGICLYIIGSTLFVQNLYNAYIVLAMHALMMLFWVVDMGLVANLARIWSSPLCGFSYYYGYSCSYGKRDLSLFEKRDDDTIVVKTYYNVLVVGALFAALQFVLWVLSAIFVILCLNKQRSTHTTTHAHPTHTGYDQTISTDQKFGHNAQPQAQPVYQQPQQPYSNAPAPQHQYAQPVHNQPPQYPQEHVGRGQTVSPVSSTGYTAPSNASELPQQGNNYSHNPNASELSTSQQTAGYDPNASELGSHR